MKSRICRIWQNELYRIRSVLVFGGMGTAAPVVGTLVNRGGYNPEARVRGGRVARTWRAGRETGQGRGGGRRSLLSPSASPLCTTSPFCACIALCCSSCKWFSRRTTPPLLLDVHVQLL